MLKTKIPGQFRFLQAPAEQEMWTTKLHETLSLNTFVSAALSLARADCTTSEHQWEQYSLFIDIVECVLGALWRMFTSQSE